MIGQLLATERRCDNYEDLRAEWWVARTQLIHRGYPNWFVEKTCRWWLTKRAYESARRDSMHSALSQDLLGEGFVVIDHCYRFRPGGKFDTKLQLWRYKLRDPLTDAAFDAAGGSPLASRARSLSRSLVALVSWLPRRASASAPFTRASFWRCCATTWAFPA
eukprot:SAG11_NODE_663_length_7869_cov_146.101158_3_plen_162_part_00